MAYLSRVRTDSCCRELQATMDERKRTNYGHLKSCGSWHSERLPRRVTQTISSSANEPKSQTLLCSGDQLPRHPYTGVHSLSTRTPPTEQHPAAITCNECS